MLMKWFRGVPLWAHRVFVSADSTVVAWLLIYGLVGMFAVEYQQAHVVEAPKMDTSDASWLD
jgi:hypothetical protein